MAAGTRNPLDDEGQPVCPVCFLAIPPGRGLIRGLDELLVHIGCDDGVMPWRPPVRSADNATASLVCPICKEGIGAAEGLVHESGMRTHPKCWPGPDTPRPAD